MLLQRQCRAGLCGLVGWLVCVWAIANPQCLLLAPLLLLCLCTQPCCKPPPLLPSAQVTAAVVPLRSTPVKTAPQTSTATSQSRRNIWANVKPATQTAWTELRDCYSTLHGTYGAAGQTDCQPDSPQSTQPSVERCCGTGSRGCPPHSALLSPAKAPHSRLCTGSTNQHTTSCPDPPNVWYGTKTAYSTHTTVSRAFSVLPLLQSSCCGLLIRSESVDAAL